MSAGRDWWFAVGIVSLLALASCLASLALR